MVQILNFHLITTAWNMHFSSSLPFCNLLARFQDLTGLLSFPSHYSPLLTCTDPTGASFWHLTLSTAHLDATRALMILSLLACFFGIIIGIMAFIHYSSFDRFDKTFAAGILFFISSKFPFVVLALGFVWAAICIWLPFNRLFVWTAVKIANRLKKKNDNWSEKSWNWLWSCCRGWCWDRVILQCSVLVR